MNPSRVVSMRLLELKAFHHYFESSQIVAAQIRAAYILCLQDKSCHRYLIDIIRDRRDTYFDLGRGG